MGEKESGSIRKKVKGTESLQMYPSNKNMIHENIEFTEVLGKHPMISSEQESKYKMLLDQKDDFVCQTYYYYSLHS